MIHKSRARASGLFLMELIIAILFFSVASAVCLQFFVKSHLVSEDSYILTCSVNECSGVAEIITASESLTDILSVLHEKYPNGKYPDTERVTALVYSLNSSLPAGESSGVPAEENIRIFFDDSFARCRETAAAYIMNIHLTCSEQMINAVIQVYENNDIAEPGEPVYLLEIKHHIARRTGL